jgi:hypothetical protein
MQTNAPIFRSTGQALHFGYLMEVLPVTQRCSTQVLIETMLKELGREDAQEVGTVNSAGLSPLELRGQCAMVRGACARSLMQPEHDVVRARFGQQRTKAAGVLGLSEYVGPLTGIDHEWAVRAVAWSIYCGRKERAADRWSLEETARETGVSYEALKRCKQVLRKTGDALESRALSRMDERFRAEGLVDFDSTVAA